jgi:hypothetical protein
MISSIRLDPLLGEMFAAVLSTSIAAEEDGELDPNVVVTHHVPTPLELQPQPEVCPVCLDNTGDATVQGRHFAMCYECGKSVCGQCKAEWQAVSETCPCCVNPFHASDAVKVLQLQKLVHARMPGRYTRYAWCALAVAHATGNVVDQDFAEATRLFTLASNQGVTDAQYTLAWMYAKGVGVPQDPNKAARLYLRAAKVLPPHRFVNKWEFGLLFGTGLPYTWG